MKFRDFLEAHSTEPALLRSAMIKKAEMMAPSSDPKNQETVAKVALSAKAMIGLMQFDVDSEWTALVKTSRPWNRKKLLKTEKDWKHSRILEMEVQAKEEVERVSVNW